MRRKTGSAAVRWLEQIPRVSAQQQSRPKRISKRSFSATRPSCKPVQVTQHVHSRRKVNSKEADASSSPPPLDLDRQAMTNQVDSLIRETRQLMGNSANIPQHLIAFSGGVDSSLAAALVHKAHVPGVERVQAVLGLSPAVPAEQVDLAVRVAKQLGVELQQVATSEGEDDVYLANEGQACLACKTHLYATLQAIVQHSENAHESFRLYNGTNADDLQDSTRLGLIAAREFHVASPLRHLPKSNVRQVARHLGLLNWNHAASPCLRSRLALGVTATAEHLQLMAQAERLVRQRLGADLVNETTNLRARLLSGHCVRIEIDKALVERTMAEDWTELQVLGGFAKVSVRAFKSGSVARKDAAVDREEEEESQAAVGFG